MSLHLICWSTWMITRSLLECEVEIFQRNLLLSFLWCVFVVQMNSQRERWAVFIQSLIENSVAWMKSGGKTNRPQIVEDWRTNHSHLHHLWTAHRNSHVEADGIEMIIEFKPKIMNILIMATIDSSCTLNEQNGCCYIGSCCVFAFTTNGVQWSTRRSREGRLIFGGFSASRRLLVVFAAEMNGDRRPDCLGELNVAPNTREDAQSRDHFR